jgi:hypothetical protein
MGTVLIGLQALMLTAALLVPPQAAPPRAQAEPAKAETSPQPQVQARDIDWPVSLERIQEAISRPPAIKTTGLRPVFRVEIFAKKPTIEDILGPDYLVGPVPYGSMTHQEFLSMVTPAEYRGMGVFTGGEALTVAATSIGLQWALMKAIDKLKAARTERGKEAARREVLAAMDELAAARKKAGLPPK